MQIEVGKTLICDNGKKYHLQQGRKSHLIALYDINARKICNTFIDYMLQEYIDDDYPIAIWDYDNGIVASTKVIDME